MDPYQLKIEVLQEFVASISKYRSKFKDPELERFFSDLDALVGFEELNVHQATDKLNSFYCWSYRHSEKGKATRKKCAAKKRASAPKPKKKKTSEGKAAYLKAYYDEKKQHINALRRERRAKLKANGGIK